MSTEPHNAEAHDILATVLKHRDYDVLLIKEADEPGYAVLCPELGCASQGDTREEALEMIADAISVFLDACIDGGEPPPLNPDAMTEMAAEFAADGSCEIEQATVRPLDWDEIIARCNDALARDAEDVSAFIERGGVFLNRRDNRRAMADYEAAIVIAPDHAEAYRGRGDAHFNLGDFDWAIADYDAALRRDPYDGISITSLENAYVALWEQGFAAVDQ